MSNSITKAPQGDDKNTVVVQTGEQSGWNSITPQQRNVITWIAIGLGVSIIAATAIYFGIRKIKKISAAKEESKSMGDRKHATWAKQIKNALDNDYAWGTDTEKLRKIIREIPSMEDFNKVGDSYRTMTEGKEEMINRLTDELKQTEYDELLAIIHSKPKEAKDVVEGAVIYDPQGWAKRLNAAINYRGAGIFWGTDEDAINAVILEMPTRQAFIDTATEYKNEYGVLLMDDMEGDLDAIEIIKYHRMILEKPVK